LQPIVLQHVKKNYQLDKVEVPALKDVNLTIEAGEFTVIAGPSGSGKTTILNLIGCVDTATSGQVMVGGGRDREVDRERADPSATLYNWIYFPVVQFDSCLECC